jgi:hypothetical protein
VRNRAAQIVAFAHQGAPIIVPLTQEALDERIAIFARLRPIS